MLSTNCIWGYSVELPLMDKLRHLFLHLFSLELLLQKNLEARHWSGPLGVFLVGLKRRRASFKDSTTVRNEKCAVASLCCLHSTALGVCENESEHDRVTHACMSKSCLCVNRWWASEHFVWFLHHTGVMQGATWNWGARLNSHSRSVHEHHEMTWWPTKKEEKSNKGGGIRFHSITKAEGFVNTNLIYDVNVWKVKTTGVTGETLEAGWSLCCKAGRSNVHLSSSSSDMKPSMISVIRWIHLQLAKSILITFYQCAVMFSVT